ncbi:uncharacterized protein N7496_001331 [Penicillium cataractarum]|uniref:Zn(2)-C6 fungal-type domain-containing protein n=1 Tax=Penicillium cataractarum TaxID=2100454 RepID=A0A9W9VVV7_9EURO|nr:uncharacterized protein N7496_001331 [Penicillium cataractarum]KAJ5390263.1 hypothetical protein N7496_001331 [Penicillium cataractarum]
MVGVPKSKGCQTCLQRRVKCDLLRPECTQCTRYGVDCPGYTRPHKFMDEGPQLRQRFKKKQSQSTATPTQPSESIDERIIPSLVAQSMGKQQPVVFGSFVLTAFTRWFGLNRYRVHMPWTAYIAQHGGQSPAFDAAIFCVNAIFMGQKHSNTMLRRSSREVYSNALRLFGGRIRNAEAMKSTESVSITIALSLFEAYSRTNPDSWAHHAAGTALLMEHRGPKAHLAGFDRCLYLSFRSFLVAEAFVRGRRCIFELPEWQEHIDQVRIEDMSSPRVDGPIALFIDLQDRIFKEVVKVPGLLVQARELHTADDPPHTRQLLSAQVLRSSQALYTLSAHLRLAAAVQSYQWCNGSAANKKKVPFIGPIPSTFPQEFANSVLRGVDHCVYILRLLLDHLESDEVRATHGRSGQDEDVSLADPLPFRFVSRLNVNKGKAAGSDMNEAEEKMPSPDKWLDLVAASMGLEAFDVITCASPSPDLSISGQLSDPSEWNTAVSIR